MDSGVGDVERSEAPSIAGGGSQVAGRSHTRYDSRSWNSISDLMMKSPF